MDYSPFLNPYYLHRYPYMRLVIPWIAGVFCGERFFGCSSDSSWGMISFGLLAALSVAFYFLKRYSWRWCFGLTVSALCLTGGWLGMTRHLQHTAYPFPEKEATYRILITDAPQPKERSYLCRAVVKEQCDTTDISLIDRSVLLYLQQDSAAARLQRGDELLVSTRISPPSNKLNFDEFDYARFLLRKGISGTGYVASGKWTTISSDKPTVTWRQDRPIGFILQDMAATYREKTVALYRALGFTGDELAVLSALTIGDKTELSDSVRESYSVAGASHILALSGLHIGLLYALLFFLLKPIAHRGKWGKRIRSFSLLAVLWIFAFFTGLSPSVVRSAGMFSALALAEMFGRESLSLNTLAAAAWVILFIHPAWLFDVGFQLSFLAVASILLFQRPIYRLIEVKSRVGKYVWGLMSVSITAQIGTAPLVMFYFSRFSVHFLLTNLVVIPLITVILYAAVIMLVLTPLPWFQMVVAIGVRKLLEGLHLFVRWVEQLPCASIDGIWLYQTEVVGIYIVISLLAYSFMRHRYRNLVIALSSLLLLGTYQSLMYWYDRPQTSLVFYNTRGCPAVHCIEHDGRSWISYADTMPDKKRLERVAANYWRRQHLLPPQTITADCLQGNFIRQGQVVSYHGCRIGVINDNRWRNKSAASPLPVRYLYLCKGYNGRLEELARVFAFSCVILDASLPEYRKQLLESECKQSGRRLISLSDEGSVRFLL